MNDFCPSTEKCPIFAGLLQGKEFTTKTYQEKYCKAGIEGRLMCKRWQVSQKFGKCPPDLLPNSTKSLDEIAKQYGYSV
ncbi:MAG: hypothetical protein JW982_06840 [Spirochaetes bacterium]|nr:hypothetical protein [Spirochaetota bacterium]